MPPAVAAYRQMVAAERLEFRLPALLKAHVQQAAENTGQTTTEYIVAALAEQVTKDLAAATEWHLTVNEQAVLLQALAAPKSPTRLAQEAAAQADRLFR